jgi:P27 family predicted phage terminase small subunit
MPGPPPTPTRLKLIRGNPGKRPISRREPRPATGKPLCPEWLCDEAHAEWQRITDNLEPMGMLHKVDHGLIVAWAVAWAQLRQATEDIAESGYTIINSHDNLVAHPAVAIRTKAIDQMIKLAGQFGLSPAARTRLETPEVEEFDPLKDLINGGNAG